MKVHQQLPEVQTGYILNPERSYFSVIVPEETINLVADPHFVMNTGYTTDVSATLQTAIKRRSRECYKIVSDNPGHGLYYRLPSFLAQNSYYTFSLDLLGIGLYSIYFADNSTNTVREEIIKAHGFWQRPALTFYTRTADVVFVCIIPKAKGTFYVDGFQVENKPYATTFASGAMARVRRDGRPEYSWLGSPNRSMSRRTKYASDGGRAVPLSDLGFDVTEFNALGFAESTNYFEDYAIIPGAYYGGSRTNRRTFTLTGNMAHDSLGGVIHKRSELGSAMTGGKASAQPVTLRFQLLDGEQPISQEIDIEGVYKSGLEGVMNNLYAERAAVVLEAGDSLVSEAGLTISEVALTTSLPSATGVIGISEDGVVTPTSTPCASGTRNSLVTGPDNNLYMACGSNIVQWNGVAWTAVYTDPNNYSIVAMCLGSDGRLYFANLNASASHLFAFSLADGSVSNLSNASLIPIGPLGGAGFASVMHGANGKVYIGGNFIMASNDNGVANTLNVVQYDIATNTFAEMGTGLGIYSDALFEPQGVYAIETDNHGLVWAAGRFTNGSSVTGAIHNIAAWDGAKWEHVGTFTKYFSPITINYVAAAPVYALKYDAKRDIMYIGGSFSAFTTFPVETKIGSLGNIAAVYYKDRGGEFGRPEELVTLQGLDSVTPLGLGAGYNGIFPYGQGDYGTVYDIDIACDGRVAFAGRFNSTANADQAGIANAVLIPSPGIAIWDSVTQRWLPNAFTITPQNSGGSYYYIVPQVAYGGRCEQVSSSSGDYNVGSQAFVPLLNDYLEQPGLSDNFFFDIHNSVGVVSAAVNSIDNGKASIGYPVFKITGPGTLHGIINYTNGKSIIVKEKLLYAGEVVTIDTTRDGHGLYSSYVGDQTNLIDIASSFPDFTLDPGINKIIISITGIDGNSSAYMSWKKYYASIDNAVDDERFLDD